VASLTVGVCAETAPGERRAALVPAVVGALRARGARVAVEAGAGRRAGFSDGAYAGAGAEVVSRAEAVARADLVRPGDTVAVVGAGPIGLAAVATAQLFSPARIIAVDLVSARLEAAERLGADAVATASESEQLVADLTGGLGADAVIEAVGVPESFELCARMVRPGGRLANVGVHGRPVTLHLEDL
jgi:threonine dehydrogenase-like Zn-dependent dehydrogenase